MVFSPGTFKGAPHSDLATLSLPGGTDAPTENRILRGVAKEFPSVTSVRVKDALDAVGDLVGRLVLAIRGASGIAILASLLVLGGAVAAGHRARLYDAVVLKVLGASRGRLLSAYALEYAALGLATAVFGLIAGSLAGWVIVAKVMHLDFRLDLTGPCWRRGRRCSWRSSSGWRARRGSSARSRRRTCASYKDCRNPSTSGTRVVLVEGGF